MNPIHEHQYESGKCTVCGAPEKEPIVEGVPEGFTAEQHIIAYLRQINENTGSYQVILQTVIAFLLLLLVLQGCFRA